MEEKYTLTKRIILWYFMGMFIEIFINAFLKIDMHGFLTHGLTMYKAYTYIKYHKIQLSFLNKKEGKVFDISNFTALLGTKLILTFLIFYSIIALSRTLQLHWYLNLLDKMSNIFSGVDSNLGIGSYLLSLTTSVVLAPILEEFLFRGLLFDIFEVKYAQYGILFGTLIFGLVHGGILPQHYLNEFLYYKTREKEGSIYTCIALHTFNNPLVDFQMFSAPLFYTFVISSMLYYIYYLIKHGPILYTKHP